MTDWLSEIRRSPRALVREPGFSIPTVLCLTLTIGAATAVFSVVDTVLVRPLPFPEPERLVSVHALIEQAGDAEFNLSPAKVEALEAEVQALDSVAAWRPGPVSLTGEGEPLQLAGALVEPDFFRALGISPLIGTDYSGPARRDERVAYLGEAVWRQEFGGDPDVIGRRIRVDGRPTTVIGVVAEHQVLPPGTGIWLPLRLDEVPEDGRHSGNVSVVARLAPGASHAELDRQLERLGADLRRRYPSQYSTHSLAAKPLRASIVGDTSRLLLVILAAVALLLFLGCTNVANLVLVRNRRRRVAVATRAALGASRGSVVRWLAGEILLLGGVATLGGSLLASLVAPWLLNLTEIVGPGIEARIFEPRTLGFACLLTLGVSLGVGLLPAIGSSRLELADVLRTGRHGGQARGGRFSRGVLIGAQAALGVVLVVAAGQTLGELRRLADLDPGFRTDGLVTVRVLAPESRYPERADFRRLFVDIREALASLPGIERAGSTSGLPVGDPGAGFSFSVEDRPPEDPNHVEIARGRLVLPDYLEAMGVRLLSGRPIRSTDTAGAKPVVLVSAQFADTYWPGEDAVGKRIKRRTYASDFPWLTVVGVVEDVRDDGLDRPIEPTIYFPHAQTDTSIGRYATFVVRSDRSTEQLVPEIRARIAEVDPELPLARVATIEQLVAESVATRRLAGRLLGVFAGIGLILLATGTYGVVAFAVTERRAELGMRKALGARPWSLVRLVLGDNLVYLAAGSLAGTVAAVALSGLIDATLMPPPQPALYAAALGLLVATGLLASWSPARRAVRLDPTISIREGDR